MRRIVLEVCVSIGALLFLTSLAAMVAHHAKHTVARREYLWAVIPWVMVAAAAFPAVWPILAAQ
jgi:hypothetical protein